MSSGSNFTANKRKFTVCVTKVEELLLEDAVEYKRVETGIRKFVEDQFLTGF